MAALECLAYRFRELPVPVAVPGRPGKRRLAGSVILQVNQQPSERHSGIIRGAPQNVVEISLVHLHRDRSRNPTASLHHFAL